MTWSKVSEILAHTIMIIVFWAKVFHASQRGVEQVMRSQWNFTITVTFVRTEDLAG
jgi:hypothetical protein